jgi:hypothetical protein
VCLNITVYYKRKYFYYTENYWNVFCNNKLTYTYYIVNNIKIGGIMELFVGLGIVWVVGFVGYNVTNRMDRYNNLKYFDVSNKLKQFKKSKEKISGTQKKFFD